MAIEEGKAAPAFSLKDANGSTVALKDFKGKNVVVYFYPKDDTPGCTKEACGFRDLWKDIQKTGTVVLGVSADERRVSSEVHRQIQTAVHVAVGPGPFGDGGVRSLWREDDVRQEDHRRDSLDRADRPGRQSAQALETRAESRRRIQRRYSKNSNRNEGQSRSDPLAGQNERSQHVLHRSLERNRRRARGPLRTDVRLARPNRSGCSNRPDRRRAARARSRMRTWLPEPRPGGTRRADRGRCTAWTSTRASSPTRAQRAKERAISNAQFHQRRRRNSLPLATASIDVAIAKNVLEYVPDLPATLDEAVRVLSPGGRLHAIDSDWGFVIVEPWGKATVDRFFAAAAPAFREPYIGRKLPAAFQAAGLSDIEVRIVPIVDRTGGLLSVLRNMRSYIATFATLPSAEVDALLRAAERGINDGTYMACLPQFLVTGTRT